MAHSSGKRARSAKGKRALTPVNDIIGPLMKDLNLPADISEKGQAMMAWEEIAGKDAGLSKAVRFMGKTLVVECRSPVWMNELSMRKPELLARIERAVGKGVVEDIRFQLKRPYK